MDLKSRSGEPAGAPFSITGFGALGSLKRRV